MTKPILWSMSDNDLIDELSRIEYHYGTVGKDGYLAYPMATSEERDRALMASALKRILTHLTSPSVVNADE